MKTKHTPGPWFTEGTQVFQGRYEPVAVCLYRDFDVSEANARLIAAAPDLLSIGMRLIALQGQWHPDRYQDEKELLLQDARAAIRKALGEEK